jgi:tripeptide aminopeptidase
VINSERLYADFMALCRIDSEPLAERLMADHLKERLTALGFTVGEDRAGTALGGNAGNVFARLEGTVPGEPLLFSCHLDRVSPGVGVKPRIEGDYIVSDGSTVLGADDGAGLAALLEGITALKEQGGGHPPIEVVLSVAEELALLGSSRFDISQVSSHCAFVLDASGPVGEIVVRAPEQVKLRALVGGRKAHAGFAPEQGVSAIQIAAHAITRMRLLRIDPETTANIGSIVAQGPTNIVADHCEVWAEARSLDPAKLQAQVNSMLAAFEGAAEELGGSVEVEVIACYQSYHLDENDLPVRRAASAARKIGLTPRYKSTGGGSDANVFNNKGVPTVVLSCGYEKPHTTDERIALKQLSLLAEWVLSLAGAGTDVAW